MGSWEDFGFKAFIVVASLLGILLVLCLGRVTFKSWDRTPYQQCVRVSVQPEGCVKFIEVEDVQESN